MKNFKQNIKLLLALPILMPCLALAAGDKVDYAALVANLKAQQPDFATVLSEAYNIEWTSQSAESSQSMPVGGGDIGLNVWVEANSLYFYISKSDALDENNVFLKVGRVKIDLDPNPFAEGTSFSQKLVLKDGHCIIKGTGKDGNEVSLKVWVDVFKPVIHVNIVATEPISTKAEFQSWRIEDIQIPLVSGFRESNDYGTFSHSPKFNQPYTQYADKVNAKGKAVIFFHKNNNKDLTMEKAIEEVGLSKSIDRAKWHDPATNFTFGGVMTGKNMAVTKPTEGTYMSRDYKGYGIASKAPATSHSINITLHTGQYKTPTAWQK